MASMPSTPRKASRVQAGFTLVELMVSSVISAFVMAALLGSLSLMAKSGANAGNYVVMEQEARRGLERFGEDVRMSRDVFWTSATDITLSVAHATDNGADLVRYRWDNAASSANYQCLLREGPDPYTGVNGTQSLITHVTALEFNRWMLGSTGAATNNIGTKQLQIRLTMRRKEVTAVATTNLVVSARYVMRNKS